MCERVWLTLFKSNIQLIFQRLHLPTVDFKSLEKQQSLSENIQIW